MDNRSRATPDGASPIVGSPPPDPPAVQPPQTKEGFSTHSVIGQIDGTLAGRPKSSAPLAGTPSVTRSLSDLPDVFGRYRVIRKLGAGAMGAVYLAEDTLLQRKVALKTPTFDNDKDGELLRRFYREARAVANLKHPNLCAVYDVGELDGRHYISMEYVPGKKLQEFIKPDKPMSEKQAMAVVRKIALGMHEAHAHGVIHRDLKPDNIMINEKGEPVVMDFGLVHKAESQESAKLTQHGSLIGSPAYMSKEQVEGDPDKLTTATDQYSLGVILYQLLTSKLPFEGGIHAVLAGILTTEPAAPRQFRSNLNPHLEAVCLKMMAKEGKDRYPSMKVAADAIAELAKGISKAAGSVAAPAPVGGSLTGGLTGTFAGMSATSVPKVAVPTRRKTAKLAAKTRLSPAARLTSIGTWWVRQPPTVRWTTLSSGGVLFLAMAAILYFQTPYGVMQIEIDDPSLSVTFDGNAITIDNDGRPIRVAATANHTLEVLRDGVAVESATQQLALKKGETRLVKVALLNGQVVVDGRPIELPQKGDKAVVDGRNLKGWHDWPVGAPQPAIAPFDAAQAQTHQKEWADYLKVPVEHTNTIGMKFVLIPPGEFMMGSTSAEITDCLKAAEEDKEWKESILSEGSQHTVILTEPFYMGVHEVTQAQYERQMGKNPSHFTAAGTEMDVVGTSDATNRPVEMVSWGEAVEFSVRLTEQENLKPSYGSASETLTSVNGTGYRLPTEAEWEFACRAGTITAYSNGNDPEILSHVGWFTANSGGATHVVGQLKANSWGLYDLHGNVWEWSHDWWQKTYYEWFGQVDAVNPFGPSADSSRRTIRGGSWFDTPSRCRAPHRVANAPGTRSFNVGIRLALTVDAVRRAIADENRFEKLVDNGVVAQGRFEDRSDLQPGWKTENGELRNIEPGYKLLNFGTKHYTNFDLVAEYKVLGAPGAIFLGRSEERDGRPKGYSVGLGGAEQGHTCAGAIYRSEYKSSNITSLHVGDPAKAPRSDEWATLEVIVQGNEITSIINGITVGKANDYNNEFPTGRVAFAVSPESILLLRNVRIRELPKVVNLNRIE